MILQALVRYYEDLLQNGTLRAPGWVYKDVIFDTKKKALPGADVPKKAKIKGFPQIFGLLEALFLYLVVWQAVSSVSGISCP